MGRACVMYLTVASFCVLIRAPPNGQPRSCQEPAEVAVLGGDNADDTATSCGRCHSVATQATPLKAKGRKPPRSTSKSPSGGNGSSGKGSGGPGSTSKPATSTSSSSNGAGSSPSQSGGSYSPSPMFNAASRTKHWMSNNTSDADKESPGEKPEDIS